MTTMKVVCDGPSDRSDQDQMLANHVVSEDNMSYLDGIDSVVFSPVYEKSSQEWRYGVEHRFLKGKKKWMVGTYIVVSHFSPHAESPPGLIK